MKMAKDKKREDPFWLPKMESSQKGPRTISGMVRKLETGDGRKSTPMEKAIKEANKTMKEVVFGKKKQGRKKKK